MDVESRKSEKWWRLIAARIAIVALLFGVFMADAWIFLGLDLLFWVSAVLAVIWVVLTLASAVAVHFDRRYIASVSEWKPSGLYYLMGIPLTLIADIIAIAYLYNRHKHLGVP